MNDRPTTIAPSRRETPRFSEREPFQTYRAVSKLAVVSCVLGMASLVAFFDASLAVIPVVGALCGAIALLKIRTHSEALTGENLALVGLVLCLLCWGGGWSWLGYTYLTEVPGDAVRITYAELQPDSDNEPSQLPVRAKELDGERVFIKGFMFPTKVSRGIRDFMLCYSNDDCCFGGSPKLTHTIRVRLKPPLSVDYVPGRMNKVAGTFRLEASGQVDGLPRAIYNIDADYIQ